MDYTTIIRKVLGIALTVIGTILLAISVKSETQYRGDVFMEDCVERARKDGAFIPTYTYISKRLFRSGLLCVALGSVFNW